jgi:hypothetical protein
MKCGTVVNSKNLGVLLRGNVDESSAKVRLFLG